MLNIPPPFKSVGEFEDAYYVLNNAINTIGGIKLAINPTPLGIATLLANVASEQLTDKSIPEHVIKYFRKNIKPATGSGNVGPDKSGTVIAEGGYFRDPTQRHATDMRAGQYADGGEVEQEPAFLEALERQRLREEAFDNEFAIEVAAQSNYAADIDPSIARYQGLPDIASYSIPESGPNKLLRGFYPPPDEEYPEGTFLDKYPIDFLYNRKNYRGLTRHTVIPESGTVNAVDRYAKPEVYAHEYRHRNFPGLSERKNRVADLLTALDERQLFEMLDSSYKRKTGSDTLDYFRYDLRFERDNPGYGVGSVIFGDEWDRGARSTRQGMQENRDDYIRARIEESPAIKLLNQYEELIEYNEELPEQNQERVEERQERESEAAVKNYAMGGVASMSPVARNMFRGYDIRRGVGAYAPYIRRA
jgi:hypothetical protein